MTTFLREQTCRHGRFFYNANDLYVGRSMGLYGEWAESEVHMFQQIVQPGDVVLEAGANIGSHTVPLARMAGPQGRVHAFEPQTHVHQLLCANLIANGLTNASTWQSALGASVQEVDFPDLPPDGAENFGGATLHVPTAHMRRVRVETVDGMNLPRLDFLKADIEGYEREMLAGARATIEQHRPIAFIETISPYTQDITEALKDYFVPLGYSCWHYITPLYNAQNFNRQAHNAFPGLWSFDLLCVPEEKAEVHGLKDARHHPTHCDDPEQWRGAKLVRR